MFISEYVCICFKFKFLGVIYVYFIKLFVFGCVFGIRILYLILFKEVINGFFIVFF